MIFIDEFLKSEQVMCPNQAMTHIFIKQGVIPRRKHQYLEEISRNTFGLHAARLPTPFVTLATRMSEFTTSSLWDAMYVQRTLIKLRCMRKTLHIFPLDLAPIVHRATMSLRIAECYQRYKKMNVRPEELLQVKREIIEFVAEKPRSTYELLHHVEKKGVLKPYLTVMHPIEHVVANAIKELWELGDLCYINLSQQWNKEKRVYGLTSTFYLDFYQNEISEEEAIVQLFWNHIQQYGPVTEKDLAWWSGLSLYKVRLALSRLSNQIIQVRVQGNNSLSYMTIDDFNAFHKLPKYEEEWVALLAYEDPTLKGYYESRYLYIKPTYYDLLFNKIGEARASIVFNGEVVGIWTWNNKNNAIEWTLFKKIPKSSHEKVKQEINRMERFLFSSL